MSIFSTILIIHIISWTLWLLSGTIGLFDRKWANRNKILAWIFVWAMIFCWISAIILSILHPNNFLFTVWVFTLYMISTWERALTKSQSVHSQQTWVDWILSLLMSIFWIIFIIKWVDSIEQNSNFSYIWIIFGMISLNFVRADRKLLKNNQPINYLKTYIWRNTWAYIASLTAFLVVNNYWYVPTIVVWLWPTILITPLIFWWINKLDHS